MRPTVSRATAGVRIRDLRRDDLELTLAWRNHEDSRIWFRSSEPLTRDGHYAWFDRFSASPSRDLMLFAETTDGCPVGQASIYNFEGRRAEVGRFLSDPAVRGRGLFRQALLLTLAVAFEDCDLDEVHLEVVANNERARRLYRSVGFVENSEADGFCFMSLPRTRWHASGDALSAKPVGSGV